ncbi:hypothetical protein ATCC90586_005614 [Pythium insidiosum]|nr:hypothetical protein ATCC90586_005614 [Pythium insidiosum]
MDRVEREWECARLQLRQLQVAAQRIQASGAVAQCREGKQLLRVLLGTMESFRSLMNSHFFASTEELLKAPEASWETASQALVTKMQRQLRVTEALCGTKTPTFEQLQDERERGLRQEENDMQEAAPDSFGLLSVIRSLRTLEHNRAFHKRLYDDLVTSGLCSKYTATNFAYGSTPFSTWRQVCSMEAIQRVVRDLKSSKRDAGDVQIDSDNQLEDSSVCVTTPCVVLGSSTGSLVFFTAQLLGMETTGVEIVPYLHRVASELAESHSLHRCHFLNDDMLNVRLVKARIVVLTSLCWDDSVYSAVQERLANQLSPGAIVIDYRDGILRGSMPRFAQVDKLHGLPVSWNQAQCIHIFERLSV